MFDPFTENSEMRRPSRRCPSKQIHQTLRMNHTDMQDIPDHPMPPPDPPHGATPDSPVDPASLPHDKTENHETR